MAMDMNVISIGGQVDADRMLLQYHDYEEYLDSLVTPTDLCYLRSTLTARTVAEMGYRTSGETLSRDAFTQRQAAVREVLYPSKRPYELRSTTARLSSDQVVRELAAREHANRVGLMATIIFVRHSTKSGGAVSGYIDYSARLLSEDWTPIFEGKKRLWPRHTDLSYFNWRMNKSCNTSSQNYLVVVDPSLGLMCQCRHDRKIVYLDPFSTRVGDNTTRSRITSRNYELAVLFDHVVRRKS